MTDSLYASGRAKLELAKALRYLQLGNLIGSNYIDAILFQHEIGLSHTSTPFSFLPSLRRDHCFYFPSFLPSFSPPLVISAINIDLCLPNDTSAMPMVGTKDHRLPQGVRVRNSRLTAVLRLQQDSAKRVQRRCHSGVQFGAILPAVRRSK